ncbi:hypothetical protein D3C74_387230 [compost metagenome]
MLDDKSADVMLGAQIDLKPMRQIAKRTPFAVVRHFTVYSIRCSFFFSACLIRCCSCAKCQILQRTRFLAYCDERLFRHCVLSRAVGCSQCHAIHAFLIERYNRVLRGADSRASVFERPRPSFCHFGRLVCEGYTLAWSHQRPIGLELRSRLRISRPADLHTGGLTLPVNSIDRSDL